MDQSPTDKDPNNKTAQIMAPQHPSNHTKVLPKSARITSRSTMIGKRRSHQFQQKSATGIAKKLNLFFFVRVLLKYLDQKDPQLRVEAQKVVKFCGQKKKMGDPQYKYLDRSIETALRLTVGEKHWNCAKACYIRILRQRNLCSETRDLDKLCSSLGQI
uniref:Uncharacterized protein n=1 Tax=Helicotheca tamesis TaxID=374047 RepID=A0A7S2E300_9STRA|mmetsp:Transcript_11514/g.15998  ORF Transcript_11514/g.15998 Transcript_11514/m.15998 type:complete len:159 (+) Transcript_11514:162-638(+)